MMGKRNGRTGAVRDRRRNRRTWLPCVAIGTAAIGVICLTALSVNLYRNRKMTEAAIAARYEKAEAETGTEQLELEQENVRLESSAGITLSRVSPDHLNKKDVNPDDLNLEPFLNQSIVTYQGKQYRRNTYVKALLCMGVDRSGAISEEKIPGEGGQADSLLLIAQDEVRNTLRILMIPRDTMTEITFRTLDWSDEWQDITQLTVAYAYGDGKEISCQNVVRAVEGLLAGFEIDHYIAADTSIINILNDAVGGVTVTVPTAGMETRDPSFVQGNRVTLQGSQAELFVRYRDTDENYTSLNRMDQQQEYITGFFRAIKSRSRENSQIVSQMFDLIQDYMLTDMGKELYLKVAMDILEGGLNNEDFFTFPGMEMSTDTYNMYCADREAAVPIILDLFYREV